MRSKVSLIAAPTGLSPGGYVAKAYADRSAPRTPVAELEVEKSGALWRIRISWACVQPVRELGDDVDRFVDAAAVLAPTVPDAPWMSMGGEALFGVRAEGLGTVERGAAPGAWKARAEWKSGRWLLELELSGFGALDAQEQLALAVWQGAEGDRAGLKSVSPGWLGVGS
jgi:hypothetical protein